MTLWFLKPIRHFFIVFAWNISFIFYICALDRNGFCLWSHDVAIKFILVSLSISAVHAANKGGSFSNFLHSQIFCFYSIVIYTSFMSKKERLFFFFCVAYPEKIINEGCCGKYKRMHVSSIHYPLSLSLYIYIYMYIYIHTHIYTFHFMYVD